MSNFVFWCDTNAYIFKLYLFFDILMLKCHLLCDMRLKSAAGWISSAQSLEKLITNCHFTPGRFYYLQTDPGELFHLFPAFVLG